MSVTFTMASIRGRVGLNVLTPFVFVRQIITDRTPQKFESVQTFSNLFKSEYRSIFSYFVEVVSAFTSPPELRIHSPPCVLHALTALCTLSTDESQWRATNICGSSVWNLLHVILLAPRILRWRLDFWEIVRLCVSVPSY